MFCCTLLYVQSSIAVILMGKRELVALLNLSSWCLVMVEWLFLAVPWGCLRFVIVVFPDHTHYFRNKLIRGTSNLQQSQHFKILFYFLKKEFRDSSIGWKTVWIMTNLLQQKPSDLDLHFSKNVINFENAILTVCI